HANEAHRQRVGHKLLLNRHRVADDGLHALLGQLVFEVAVEQARKVAMQSFVARNQLVREGQAGHQAALLEPENRAERAREKDAFHGRKGDEALGEVFRVNPRQSPLAFALHGGHGFEGVEEVVLFLGVFDVGINQQRIRLAVNVFHHNL
nr:hypothetical protein [Tanacetum cinerariifolium]